MRAKRPPFPSRHKPLTCWTDRLTVCISVCMRPSSSLPSNRNRSYSVCTTNAWDRRARLSYTAAACWAINCSQRVCNSVSSSRFSNSNDSYLCKNDRRSKNRRPYSDNSHTRKGSPVQFLKLNYDKTKDRSRRAGGNMSNTS